MYSLLSINAVLLKVRGGSGIRENLKSAIYWVYQDMMDGGGLGLCLKLFIVHIFLALKNSRTEPKKVKLNLLYCCVLINTD